jgi:hypothetical protein
MVPYNMDRCNVTADQNEAAQQIALSIFTDMSNASFSFREALAAIYLSGMQHAVSILQDETL